MNDTQKTTRDGEQALAQQYWQQTMREGAKDATERSEQTPQISQKPRQPQT